MSKPQTLTRSPSWKEAAGNEATITDEYLKQILTNQQLEETMKTAKEMAKEIEASSSEYVTYGESDLGTPVKREDAIADILSMDDDMIGPGDWAECDSEGNIL